MALVILFETQDSQEQTVALAADGNVRILRYMAYGSLLDADVEAAVQENVPAFYDGFRFHHYTISHQGNGVWDVEVQYGAYGQKKTGSITFNFDTTGERAKIKTSLAQTSYVAVGQKVTNFQNCIEVSRQGATAKVEGVEITIPKFEFTVSIQFGPGQAMDGGTFQMIYNATGCVNSDTVSVTINGVDLVFNPGELLFQGATGNQKSGGVLGGEESFEWEGEVLLKFAAQQNLSGLTIGTIANIKKDGWDYLWCSYSEMVNNNTLIPQINQVNVEQVYPRVPLAPLFFGGTP